MATYTSQDRSGAQTAPTEGDFHYDDESRAPYGGADSSVAYVKGRPPELWQSHNPGPVGAEGAPPPGSNPTLIGGNDR